MILARLWNFLEKTSDAFYRPFFGFLEEVGNVFSLFLATFAWLFRPPFRFRLFVANMDFIGLGSIGIVALVASFTGAAFSLQTVYTFKLFQAEAFIGVTVALSLSKELAPVLTALMVTARAGSAMATELGSMRITEQIDAMYTMAVSPIQYLVVPRIIASIIMVPFLTMVFNLVGIMGASFVAVTMMGVDAGPFWHNIMWFIDAKDILEGIIKAVFFGAAFSTIACYQGFYASGGAAGVGRATTQAVVRGSVTILFLDVMLTDILLLVFRKSM
ncbi:ABC transporter permease [Myxococcota bacterium]|nr:ABC transporter permease [Myxococcota bacterium]MBU1382549.1 ABC transporter permease [Myxococcota bacterium]MBU1497441.1 ABC transporter permease [Myxococcota bacterium]